MDENDQMNQLTCKLKDEQLQEKLNSSIEKENEEFLKESDDESFSSTSSEEINDNIKPFDEFKIIFHIFNNSWSVILEFIHTIAELQIIKGILIYS